jgi:hypothetical protein
MRNQALRRAGAALLRRRVSILSFNPTRFEEQLVWIVGSPRTGSTWLLNLIAWHSRVVPVNEPRIGFHLTPFDRVAMPGLPEEYDHVVSLLPEARSDNPQYFLAQRAEWVWRPHLRRLLLARLHLEVELANHKGPKPLVLVKEPGAIAPDFVLGLLPRARLIFLVRDPRDVLSSLLDAVRGGSWAMPSDIDAGIQLTAEERRRFLLAQARQWLVRTEHVQKAYAARTAEDRMMVRYEDLRRDPEPHLSTIFQWLGLQASGDELQSRVAKLSFEALPEDKKGEGKFTRSAAPGNWRQDLTLSEQQAIEDVLGPKLKELGYQTA